MTASLKNYSSSSYVNNRGTSMPLFTGFLVVLVSFIPLVSSVHSTNYKHTIYISPSAKNAKDNKTCLTSNSVSVPCCTLTWVFMQHPCNSSTHYVLTEEKYSLTDHVPVFEGLTSLAITGGAATGQPATITCASGEGIGLAFINVTNITLSNVVFHKCGALRNSTSRRYNKNGDFELYRFYAALYFYRCSNINMTLLVVRESPNATAVVMYNTVGYNTIRSSEFTKNRLESASTALFPGGGGFSIEFTFCAPGDDTCDDSQSKIGKDSFNANSAYYFRNSTFSHNKAGNLEAHQKEDTFVIPNKRTQNAFGKGGGLSIIFKGNSSGNAFEIAECVFESNEAVWGGGMLVEFQDHSGGNTVLITNTEFRGNHVPYSDTMDSAGGGLKIGQYVFDSTKKSGYVRNKLLVRDCNFYGNSAMNGGGVSLLMARQLANSCNDLLKVSIVNANISENVAQTGSALESTVFSLLIRGELPPLTVESSQFVSNRNYNNSDSPAREEGVGAVYANAIPLNFQGEITFSDNVGSALVMVGTFVNFSECLATFTSNRGRHGGAVNILGTAFIIVDDDTSLTFKRNEALVHGGAIANVFIERENFKTYPNCFIHHQDPFAHPRDWQAQFIFVDNSAGTLGQSIHTTSLHPCAWAGGSGVSDQDKILCWEGWSYNRNGTNVDCHGGNEINTESGTMFFQKHDPDGDSGENDDEVDDDDDDDEEGRVISVIPGKEFKLPLVIQDDLGANTSEQTVFTALSLDTNVSTVNPRFSFVSHEHVVLDGIGGSNVTILLHTNSERSWEVKMKVKLRKCPPGLVPSDPEAGPTSSCVCNEHNYQQKLVCTPGSYRAHVVNGYWFGKIEDVDTLVSSLCLPGFCQKEKYGLLKPIPEREEELDEVMCGGEVHRTGILCGECKDGYGPAVNRETYDCILCNDTTVAANFVKYLSSIYLPLLGLFVFIILFNIRLTSGSANAFIFYAQVIASNFDLNADGHIPLNTITNHSDYLLQAYRLPYGVFNLDFIENLLSPLCLGTSLNALDVLQLDYLIACFPLLMIVAVVIIVKIRDSPIGSCCRCSFRNSKWKFLRHWRVNESLLHVFSAFLLLSYTKFSLTSSYIVNICPFYDADGEIVGEKRVYYAGQLRSDDVMYIFRYYIPAWFALVLITLPPLVLFGYPVVWFEKCIIKVKCLWRFYPADKVQIFLDTFQGCYKDNRRFFAGMYFAFRLTINVAYIVTNDWLQQFVVQQIACSIFIFIVAFCWPYRDEQWYLNYVDLLIFTNLAIVNAFSLYLFVYPHINSSTLPLWPFVVQYILVFIPLLYMLVYVFWYLLSPSQKEKLKKLVKAPLKKLRKRQKDKYLRTTLLGPSEGVVQQATHPPLSDNPNVKLNQNGISTTEVTMNSGDEEEEEREDSHLGSGDSDEDDLAAILVRAETQNTYRSTNKSISKFQSRCSSNKYSNNRSRRTKDSGLGTTRYGYLTTSPRLDESGEEEDENNVSLRATAGEEWLSTNENGFNRQELLTTDYGSTNDNGPYHLLSS